MATRFCLTAGGTAWHNGFLGYFLKRCVSVYLIWISEFVFNSGTMLFPQAECVAFRPTADEFFLSAALEWNVVLRRRLKRIRFGAGGYLFAACGPVSRSLRAKHLHAFADDA